MRKMTYDDLVEAFTDNFTNTPANFTPIGGATLEERINYFEDFKQKLIQSGNDPLEVNRANRQATQEYEDLQMAKRAMEFAEKRKLKIRE